LLKRGEQSRTIQNARNGENSRENGESVNGENSRKNGENYSSGTIYYGSLIYLVSKVWTFSLKTKEVMDTTPAIKTFLALLEYMNLIVKHWVLL
jgi:hypothetical protein